MGKVEVKSQEELEKQLSKELENAANDILDETNLSDVDLSEFLVLDGSNTTQYTTEVLEKREEIKSAIGIEEYKELIGYIKGDNQRPAFADTMLTQLSERYEEFVKIVMAFNLAGLPKLYDYQRILEEKLYNPDNIKNMTYNDMSTELDNVNKRIDAALNLALKVATQLTRENKVPTQVERIANLLMVSPESVRRRIEEILQDYQE